MSLTNFSQLGNKYILLDLLGVGGMAEVYRCKLVGQQGFEKIIVLKKLLSEAAKDKELVANFIDEARLAALLQHENIGHVYDFGEIDGNYFIAMEYLFGKDLQTIIQRAKEHKKPIGVEPALIIASKICEGMGYAHGLKDLHGRPLNIIHRDLTPHNVFVTYDGKVKIIDFGVARAELFDHRTKAGVVKGKVSYMSPEQLTGEGVDYRSDIFSIGILLYEMLSGRKMYDGDTATLIRKCMQVDYLRLKSVAPGLPKEVYPIVGKALEVDKNERYQSCAEMAAAIDDFLYHLQQRPSKQKLKSYLHSQFGEEFKAEKAKLVETANKIDEMYGSDESNREEIGSNLPVPDPDDKTLIVDTTESPSGQGGSQFFRTVGRMVKLLSGIIVLGIAAAIAYSTLMDEGKDSPRQETQMNWNAAGTPATQQDAGAQNEKAQIADTSVENLLQNASRVLLREELGNARLEKAADFYQQALKIEPENATAFEGLRSIYEQYAEIIDELLSQKNFAEAEKNLRSAQVAFPGSMRVAALQEEVKEKKNYYIEQLRVKAMQAMENNDLTMPLNNSAYGYYSDILKLDSENVIARKGIRQIADRYVAMAESSFRDENYSQAQIYVERGLAVAPQHPSLLELGKSVLEKCATFIETNLKEGNLKIAGDYAEASQKLFPKNSRIATLVVLVEQEKKKSIKDYLANADSALKRNDLTTPPESSAYFFYSKVLELDETNGEAKAGLQQISDRYAALADSAVRSSNWSKAMIYVERGLNSAPSHSPLLKIKDRVIVEYEKTVKRDLGHDRIEKAEEQVNSLEKAFPRDKRVASLRAEIESRKAQLIKGYRLKAQRALSKNNLMTPKSTSAYTYYRRILVLDSDNKAALNGLKQIGDKYASLADESYRNLKFEQARVYVERGLMVAPDNTVLLQIKKDLSRSKPGVFFKAIKKNINSAF